MDKEFTLEEKITFEIVLEMYDKIISVGLRPFSFYGLFAANYDQGIMLGSDSHSRENSCWVSISEDHKERDLIKKLQEGTDRLQEDLSDLQSRNIIIANSPKIRYNKDLAKWSVKDIISQEIETLNMYKQAYYFPIIGEPLNFQLPFVDNRDIFINKNDGVYSVRLSANSQKDLSILERTFLKVLDSGTKKN